MLIPFGWNSTLMFWGEPYTFPSGLPADGSMRFRKEMAFLFFLLWPPRGSHATRQVTSELVTMCGRAHKRTYNYTIRTETNGLISGETTGEKDGDRQHKNAVLRVDARCFRVVHSPTLDEWFHVTCSWSEKIICVFICAQVDGNSSTYAGLWYWVQEAQSQFRTHI